MFKITTQKRYRKKIDSFRKEKGILESLNNQLTANISSLQTNIQSQKEQLKILNYKWQHQQLLWLANDKLAPLFTAKGLLEFEKLKLNLDSLSKQDLDDLYFLLFLARQYNTLKSKGLTVLVEPKFLALNIQNADSLYKNIADIYKKYNISSNLPALDEVFVTHAGLKFLPPEVIAKLKGTVAFSAGAYWGDSPISLYEYYNFEKIFGFEPLFSNFQIMESLVNNNNLQNTIIPIQKGLGEKEETLTFQYDPNIDIAGTNYGGTFINSKTTNKTESLAITTIDQTVAQYNLNKVGFIHLDVEGFEQPAIRGALTTIKRDKPVLSVSLYHNFNDFTHIKPLIESLNLGYKIIIRRLSTTPYELSLLAY